MGKRTTQVPGRGQSVDVVTEPQGEAQDGAQSGALEAPLGSLEKLVGLVLCGGKSQRMGEDKAQLDFEGDTLLERACGFLERDTLEVVLSTGKAPRGDSSRRQVADLRSDAGPLAGLEAGLSDISERYGAAWVLVLACDMPRAERDLFDHLLAAAQLIGADAAMFSSDAGDEPLFAVYHTRLLPAITAALDAGRRRMNSFHDQDFRPALGAVDSPALDKDEPKGDQALGDAARLPQIVRLGMPSAAPLCNINTPLELTQARAAFKADNEQAGASKNEMQP
ncbi:MAG: molybdopterin-guanine dinucleotide biosynthesis protein A [Planctomycetota bacterium]